MIRSITGKKGNVSKKPVSSYKVTSVPEKHAENTDLDTTMVLESIQQCILRLFLKSFLNYLAGSANLENLSEAVPSWCDKECSHPTYVIVENLTNKSNHTAVKTSRKHKNVNNKEDVSVECSKRKRTAACQKLKDSRFPLTNAGIKLADKHISHFRVPTGCEWKPTEFLQSFDHMK